MNFKFLLIIETNTYNNFINFFSDSKSIIFFLKYLGFILTMHVILFSLSKVSLFKIPPIFLYKSKNKKLIYCTFLGVLFTILIWIVNIFLLKDICIIIYIMIFGITLILLTILLINFFMENYRYMTETEDKIFDISKGKELYTIIALVDPQVEYSEISRIFYKIEKKLEEKERKILREKILENISSYYSNKNVEYLFFEYILNDKKIQKDKKEEIIIKKINDNKFYILSYYTISRIKKKTYKNFTKEDFLIDYSLEKSFYRSIGTGEKINHTELKKTSDFVDEYVKEIKGKLNDNILMIRYFSQFLLNKSNDINSDLYFKKFINLIFVEDNMTSYEMLESLNYVLKYCIDFLTFKIKGKENIITSNNSLESNSIYEINKNNLKLQISMEEELTYENVKSKIEEKIKNYSFKKGNLNKKN